MATASSSSRPSTSRGQHYFADGIECYEPAVPYSSFVGKQQEHTQHHADVKAQRGQGGRKKRSSDPGYHHPTAPEIGLAEDEYVNIEDNDEEIYLVRQNIGYCAIAFSVVQTVILGLMMWQCGIAPLNIK
jgi:hypothetical protein